MSLDATLTWGGNTTVRACGGRILGVATPVPEAGESTAIVETRASGVARPIVPSVNTCYPTCVSTGAPTAATGDQNREVLLLRKLADNLEAASLLLFVISWAATWGRARWSYFPPHLRKQQIQNAYSLALAMVSKGSGYFNPKPFQTIEVQTS